MINKEENNKLLWHIYIDNSLSLNYYKQPSNTSFIKGLSNFINQLKNKNIDSSHLVLIIKSINYNLRNQNDIKVSEINILNFELLEVNVHTEIRSMAALLCFATLF